MQQWLSFHQEGYFIFSFFPQVAVERWNLHLVQRHHLVAVISDYSSQCELITTTKSQERQTFLLGDSDRLRSSYFQCCTAHSSVNFISIFSTEKAVSILARGKRRRTRMTYSSCGTQLYTIKSLLLPFWPKEGTRSCVTSLLLISSGLRHFMSGI